jgi:hypothetical protein
MLIGRLGWRLNLASRIRRILDLFSVIDSARPDNPQIASLPLHPSSASCRNRLQKISSMRPVTLHPLDPAKYRTAESAMVDRRKSIRVPHQATFQLRPLLNNGIGEPITVVLQDLSATGMGVFHSHPMACGEQFQIPLSTATPLSLICSVVRCEKMDEGLYSVGFEFNSSAAAVDAGSRQLTGHPVPRE